MPNRQSGWFDGSPLVVDAEPRRGRAAGSHKAVPAEAKRGAAHHAVKRFAFQLHQLMSEPATFGSVRPVAMSTSSVLLRIRSCRGRVGIAG